ncbi:transposase IS116/IS110/IS902 family protein [mine drainage metagenome]|uniref:Transposase IS116/IS110/IS902 family protein n=1 Tax=mine drainage metagenome TaxID=410659 RepID=T1A9G2_9ZZZZ
MEVIHNRCAGLDISKRDAKVSIRIADSEKGKAKSTVTTWGSVTNQILLLRDHLIEQRVTLVVMEATSDYWKPFYYLLEDASFEVMLVNARHAKNLPGRKTDVSDAAWLADLGAHGLVHGSFVPPEPIRELRDLTRTRTTLVRERAREIQRLEKLLEDSGIKLSSVATDITGVSGREMLEALIAGQRDPVVLAELAKGRLRSKIPELLEALTGRFREHHGFLARLHLDLIDNHTNVIDELTARIEVMVKPFREVKELLVTIPGVSQTVADVIIAETGGDMTKFPTPGHLASWAGTCPGSNESAGRVKSTRTRPGNPYLKGALGIAALSAARNKNTYYSAKYRRIASRRGPVKAVVAIEHAILIAIWNMITNNNEYVDPGVDYFTRLNPERAKNKALAQLRNMGYDVTIEPLVDAV